MSKPIHIVFQVLNFLHSDLSLPYNLSDDEQLLLINLASHNGSKGIFPSVSTMAKERKRSIRPIQYTLKKLAQKKLIIIEEIRGKSNRYILTIPDNTPATDSTPAMDSTPATDSIDPCYRQHPTPATGSTLITKIRTKKNKDIKACVENRKKRQLLDLPANFLPNETHEKISKENGLNLSNELSQFKDHHLSKGSKFKDWDAALRTWLRNAIKFRNRNVQFKVTTSKTMTRGQMMSEALGISKPKGENCYGKTIDAEIDIPRIGKKDLFDF